MNNERKSISIKHIMLDIKNPRHDPSEAQKEALQKLLKDENIRQLASDIVSYGINPTELLIVMPNEWNEKKYIALEGNRRLSALKALQKPILCSEKSDEAYFSKLAKKYKGTFNLDCILMDSRKKADHWIQLKHGTNQGGAAPKRWDATQSARNAELNNTKGTNDRAFKLLKYALDYELITKKQHEKINITTITRYLSNPKFRASTGVDFKDGKLTTNLTLEKLHEVISRFLLDDLVDPKDGGLSSRSKAPDRIAYGEKLLVHLKLHEHKSDEYYQPAMLPVTPPSSASVPEKPSTLLNNRNPNNRSKLIPNDVKLIIRSPKIKRIYDELRKIDIKIYPNATALLFRMFIELTIHDYLKEVMRLSEANRDLHKLIIKVADDLESKKIPKKKLTSLRSIATTPTTSSPLSITLMNNYVHGVVEPCPKDLIRAWDPIQEGIFLIYEEINNSAGQTS